MEDLRRYVNFYQTIPEMGIKGRYKTPLEYFNIDMPERLDGWSFLDIGCNIGAFLIEAKRRGADLVAGVEPNPAWRWLGRGIVDEFPF